MGEAARLTRLARLAKASWGYPEAWLREWEPELEISADYIRLNDVFVAESEGRLLGVVGVGEGTTPDAGLQPSLCRSPSRVPTNRS